MFRNKSDKTEAPVSSFSFFSLMTPKTDPIKEMEKQAERCFGISPKITVQQKSDRQLEDAFETAMNISF